MAVDVAGDSARGVAHAFLQDVVGGAEGDEEAGGGVAQAVEGEPLQAGGSDGRAPDPGSEVGGPEWAAVGGHEDEFVGPGPSPAQQVDRQHRRQEGWDREHPATGGGLDVGEVEATFDLGQGLDYGQAVASEVDAANPEAGDLGPPQPEHPGDVDHGAIVHGHGVGEPTDLFGGEEPDVTTALSRQVDAPARRAEEQVSLDGSRQDRSEHGVVGAHGGRGEGGGHGRHQALDVQGGDIGERQRAEAGAEVHVHDVAVPGEGRGPLVQGGGEVGVAPFIEADLTGPGVDPAAPPDVGLDGGEPGVGVGLGSERIGSDEPLAVVPVAGLPVQGRQLSGGTERAPGHRALSPFSGGGPTGRPGATHCWLMHIPRGPCPPAVSMVSVVDCCPSASTDELAARER